MLGEILLRTQKQRPLVHCIANYVTANDCANLLLAMNASPVMADEPLEMEDINALCSGHVLNLGTLNEARIDAMLTAGRAANRQGRPLILDPVGVGASAFRRNAAMKLLDKLSFSVIRGNASEIETLVSGVGSGRGVDADLSAQTSCENAVELAQRSGAVIVMSGEKDVVADGRHIYRVYNGDAMMGRVTGAGCMLSALIGAFVSANPENVLEASLAAVCMMGVCGEHARRRMNGQDGNGSYRNYLIDAINRLRPEELEEEAHYEME